MDTKGTFKLNGKSLPRADCSEQDICDMKRTIEQNGYLTEIEIETIKEQMQFEVQGNNIEGEPGEEQNQNTHIRPIHHKKAQIQQKNVHEQQITKQKIIEL